MRDPARIEPLLQRIKEVWIGYPHLRLGQIVVNCAKLPIKDSSQGIDPFYIEDDKLVENIERLLPKRLPMTKEEYERIDAEIEEQCRLMLKEGIPKSFG